MYERWLAYWLGRATVRERSRGKRALDRGKRHYMHRSSRHGCALIYAGGIVYEELWLATGTRSSAVVLRGYRKATKKERARYG